MRIFSLRSQLSMEANSHLLSKYDRLFSQPPRDNLSSDKAKRYFSTLRNFTTSMTYTMSYDQAVLEIVSSSNCVKYLSSAFNLIIDELSSDSTKHFDDPVISNFIMLYAAIWDVTDKSPDVCNRFILAKVHLLIWKLLSKPELYTVFYEYSKALLLVHCSLGTLHNLLNHCPRAREYYRACGGLKILGPYVGDSYVCDTEILTSLKSAALFTLAAIVSENEDVSIITTDQKVLTYVLSALKDSLQSPPDYYSTKYGYHAAEVFGCLGCLAGPESNKRNIFENNALDLISTALKIAMRVKMGSLKVVPNKDANTRHFYRFSESKLANEAINLLWHLSCLPEVKDQLKETSDLYKLCTQFNDSKWTSECRKSVQALLCTLSQQMNCLDAAGNVDTSAITVSPKPRGHVMISYNNQSQDLVSGLKEALAIRGWNVWIFTEHCHHGSVLDQIAEAVNDSAALILCLSNAYNDSQQCTQVVNSAYLSRIPMLPVFVEPDYEPIKFLRFVLTGVQPVQLYEADQLEKAADRLTEQLRSYGVMRRDHGVDAGPLPTPSLNPLNMAHSSAATVSEASQKVMKRASGDGFVKGHQRSRSDCLLSASGPRKPIVESSMQPSLSIAHPVVSLGDRLPPPPPIASMSPSQVHRRTCSGSGACENSQYFFCANNSTPHCVDAPLGFTPGSLPVAFESYLISQVPAEGVRDWPEERVHAWLTDNALGHCIKSFERIGGSQLYELAWQRIRGCDSFFRCLAFDLKLGLHEQMLLSSALASLHRQ